MYTWCEVRNFASQKFRLTQGNRSQLWQDSAFFLSDPDLEPESIFFEQLVPDQELLFIFSNNRSLRGF